MLPFVDEACTVLGGKTHFMVNIFNATPQMGIFNGSLDNLFLFTARSSLIPSTAFSISPLQRDNKSLQLNPKTPPNFFAQLRKCKTANNARRIPVSPTVVPFVFSLFAIHTDTNAAASAQVVEQKIFSYQLFRKKFIIVSTRTPPIGYFGRRKISNRMLIICCAHVGVKK